MVIVFALLALAVLVTANWYLWRRLFRDTTGGPGRVRRAGAVLIGGGWVLAIAALVAERTGAPFWLQRVLAWPGFLWLALSIYLLLAVVAGEVVRPLLRRLLERRDRRGEPAVAAAPHPERVPAGASAEKPREAAGAPAEPGAGDPQEPGPPALVAAPSRRLFVSRVVAGAAAAAAVGTVGLGTYGVLRGPGVKRVTVPLAKLPRAAHGYRIAVVSDIHLSPVLGRGFAQKVVDTINSTRPDLIAVVGDLVDGSVKDLGPAAAPLARLEARHGSFFVTGNHEYFSGAEQWVEEVRRLGLRPLENDRTELAWFDLAGVNDIAGESEGQGPDFAKALGDRDTARACVLLAHQPVQIHDAVDHGVDLQLSGHTHGGQLWPGNLLAKAANPTVAGLERYGDTQLYVSRGAGAWGPPTRVGAPSDITVIELASEQA
ncbi:metallophosphoesterase [Streptomyces pseudovenezuelae]|uniref:metallophosphoesterase n=1 Tax=Streptomyces pseudovenezuelae TaxID=67350 RepID=UPI002E30C113|nr:metallophosphoesterase [Streptomyces pseudovenezuelae]